MIAILDYGAGNLTSVRLAFERIGANAIIVDNADDARAADRIVFPGVGSARSGMDGLARRGFHTLLKDAAARRTPVLAICLGMQMLFASSEEDDGVQCLDIIPGSVKLFHFPASQRVKVPHMGWNTVALPQQHPLLAGIGQHEAFYFVHSYYAKPDSPEHTLGISDYADFSFCAITGRGSVFGTQFHPERSGDAGLRILQNFTTWDTTSCC
ncbi:MAG: imidazole glycerol phosphate synthase subunit HisH [Lentisphaerae bacterium]|jgi:glutamine amidotransferase|nr:imidazole glycerol phosphate synthase subunit HisH [Lentisphaeria bacterium]NLE55582.1 imidazole glycerol phosphate synthase subunit HisH [Lentisphaerota bacterium]HQL09745.1 imidazole glycerol phosphate synthase subunit HisH [Lentisphaeria bacterium]